MSRVLAWLVLGSYFCAALMSLGWSAAFEIALFLAVPLACILWPEGMADAGRGIRTVPLPPEMVFALGWFVFILPAILVGVLWLVL
jgi:hypothetical protein